MKKKIVRFISSIIIGVIILILILIYQMFYNINNIPLGTFVDEYSSPTANYVLRVYKVDYHSTVAPSMRVELVCNGKPKNIYWDYRIEDVTIEWINDSTVCINNHIIDLPNGKYDFRYSND